MEIFIAVDVLGSSRCEPMHGTNRTLEDRIADKDSDWVKARNSAVAHAYDRMDDGPADIHEARENNVHKGEKEAMDR